MGRREEALDAIIEAVDLYRRLVEQRPDAFTPDLAMSLNNLSNRLSDLGRREEALDAITEAVEIYRRLVEQRPDTFTPNLAGSLNNLSNRLSDLGRREEALDAIIEAVEIYRRLVEQRPDAFTPDLAMSLNNLCRTGCRLWGVARRPSTRSPKPSRSTVGWSSSDPDTFTPDLAMSLNNLSAGCRIWGAARRPSTRAPKPFRQYCQCWRHIRTSCRMRVVASHSGMSPHLKGWMKLLTRIWSHASLQCSSKSESSTPTTELHSVPRNPAPAARFIDALPPSRAQGPVPRRASRCTSRRHTAGAFDVTQHPQSPRSDVLSTSLIGGGRRPNTAPNRRAGVAQPAALDAGAAFSAFLRSTSAQ